MAFDVNLLKTRPQCVTAKASLEAELDGYSNKDQNLGFQDRQAGRSEASVASRLATATSQLAYFTGQLARPDLSDVDRRRYTGSQLSARFQKERLDLRAADEGGSDAFLADVDADQIDGQVAILTAAIAAAQTRHDALPA